MSEIVKLYDNDLYTVDVKKVADTNYLWKKLNNKKVMISGAYGMIGSFLIDVIMYRNEMHKMNCTIVAIGRNREKAEARFKKYWNEDTFIYINQDINKLVSFQEKVDYIIHAASNTHPISYSTDPIGTITTNIIGTYNLLEYACSYGIERFVFLSSVEVYGENRGDVDEFPEDYCGYINSNTLRAGYPESKRVGETLCQAYIKQKGLDIVIPRLARSYGPTMQMSDSKAISQFIKKGVDKEDIILKSEGDQFYSYTYMADAVSGILAVMFNGIKGEAYNISDENSNISLKDLAEIIAKYVSKNIIFELPDETEKAGYSKATKATMASDKIRSIGWKSNYNIKNGIERTIEILQ